MFTNHKLVSNTPICNFDYQISLFGINHQRASVEQREIFALDKDSFVRHLKHAKQIPGVEEAVVISTCNRTELVSVSRDALNLEEEFRSYFKSYSGAENASLENFYYLTQEEAVSHIFKVASGLDSMILGESQILGQLKSFYEIARNEGTTSRVLNKLFTRAFGVSKAVKTRTKLGQQAVSICYAVKLLAEQIFGGLEDSRVLIFGTGDIASLSAKYFKSAKIKEILVVSRNYERALNFAKEHGATPINMEKLGLHLSNVNILVGASSRTENDPYFFGKEAFNNSSFERAGMPLLCVDLAMPRNLDPELKKEVDVYLYDLDDLGEIVDKNTKERSLEAQRASSIVKKEVEKFIDWCNQRAVDVTIAELQQQIKQIASIEISKSIKKIESADINKEHLLNNLVDAVIAKVFHNPFIALKEGHKDNPEKLDFFQELFDLSDVKKNQEQD